MLTIALVIYWSIIHIYQTLVTSGRLFYWLHHRLSSYSDWLIIWSGPLKRGGFEFHHGHILYCQRKEKKKIKSREIKKKWDKNTRAPSVPYIMMRVLYPVWKTLIVLVTEDTVISIKLRNILYNILYKPHVVDEDFVVLWYAWTLIFFSSFLLINEDIYDNSHMTHHMM